MFYERGVYSKHCYRGQGVLDHPSFNSLICMSYVFKQTSFEKAYNPSMCTRLRWKGELLKKYTVELISTVFT